MAWLEDQYRQTQSRSSMFISIPTRGFISNNSLGALLGLRIPGTYGMPTYSIETGQAIDVSRNIAVSKCLQMNSRYMLFIDSDMTFAPDTLERLLGYRVPVASVAYRSRGPPYHLVSNVNNKPVDDNVLKDKNIDLMQVDNVGMGFCLIDTRILKSLAYRLNEFRCFLDHTKEIKKDVAIYTAQQAIDQNFKCSICQKLLVARYFWSRAAMANKDAISEDYWFCKLCKDNNIPIHLATKVFANHESAITLGVDGPESNLRSIGDVS